MEKKTLPINPFTRTKPLPMPMKNQSPPKPGPKTTSVKSPKKTTSYTNDKVLDRMIYALYELTEEEIEILESR